MKKVSEYENTTITHCRPTHGTVRKSYKTPGRQINVFDIYTEVLAVLLFRTNNKEGIGRSKAVVLFLLIRC